MVEREHVIYDDQYIKTKVKTFKMVKNLFSDDIIPEEKVECECIPCISADSVLKIEKKWYPQVYLEQCKYKVEERKIKNLIDYDLDSDYKVIKLVKNLSFLRMHNACFLIIINSLHSLY